MNTDWNWGPLPWSSAWSTSTSHLPLAAHRLTLLGCRLYPALLNTRVRHWCPRGIPTPSLLLNPNQLLYQLLGFPSLCASGLGAKIRPAASSQQVQHLQTHRCCADPVGDASDPQRKRCLRNTRVGPQLCSEIALLPITILLRSHLSNFKDRAIN